MEKEKAKKNIKKKLKNTIFLKKNIADNITFCNLFKKLLRNNVMKNNVYNTALNLLNIFLEEKITKYSKLRNYDYGQESPHKIVSGLSPYISHGIINELDILNKLLNSKNQCDKFKQEILWRTY